MRIRTVFLPASLCFVAAFGCGSESGAEPTAAARNEAKSDSPRTVTPTAPAANTPMTAPSGNAAGTAGGANPPPAMSAPVSTDTSAMQPSAAPAAARSGDAVTEPCDLHTQWEGDEYCIKPPPADKGFQIHIGPTDYANPEPKYLMEPGTE